jgi:hypothetical protein
MAKKRDGLATCRNRRDFRIENTDTVWGQWRDES